MRPMSSMVSTSLHNHVAACTADSSSSHISDLLPSCQHMPYYHVQVFLQSHRRHCCCKLYALFCIRILLLPCIYQQALLRHNAPSQL